MRKWALVTGAGKRLGRAVALELGRAGWGVVAHYNASAKDAEDVAAEIRAMGSEAATFSADLSHVDALAKLVADAQKAAQGALTGLVNSAAMFEHDVVDTVLPTTLDHHMRVNALAPALLARALTAELEEGATGAVVNFLDFKLATPYPDHFSYTLSKYALAGATELLARGLAPRVRVNAVAPGYVLPAPGQSEDDYKKKHADTPLARGTTPEDIAGAVRFLLENPAITAQTIFVDSGLRFRSFERDIGFE